jgi:hypothetical protein
MTSSPLVVVVLLFCFDVLLRWRYLLQVRHFPNAVNANVELVVTIIGGGGVVVVIVSCNGDVMWFVWE